MSFIDDFAYDVKLGLYNVGLRGTPPIVLPADSIQSLEAQTARQDAANVADTYTIPNMLGTAVSETATDIAYTYIPILIGIAVVGFTLYIIARKELKI